MPIDYVSTVPWNDPFNPWPAYLKYVVNFTTNPLSACTVELTSFAPLTGCTDPAAATLYFLYTAISEPGNMTNTKLYYYTSKPFDPFESLVCSAIFTSIDPVEQFEIEWEHAPRTPFKAVGTTAPWTWVNQAALDVIQLSAISIIPVLSSVAPWEQRRHRLLEII